MVRIYMDSGSVGWPGQLVKEKQKLGNKVRGRVTWIDILE
jgi:hypothetical protein